jgi:hypothetical protein
VDNLDDMVIRYCNTNYCLMLMAAVEASKPENVHIVYTNWYGDNVLDSSVKPQPKFYVGDEMHITKKHELFHRSHFLSLTE